MHTGLLHLHNVTRWVVLVALVAVLVRALRARLQGAPLGPKAALPALITMDLQLVLGLVLYVISPLVKAARADFGAAMKSDDLRYFAVEHLALMLVAIVGIHVVHVLVKKSEDAGRRATILLAGTSVVAGLVLVGIPWFRPLFPGM